MGGLQMIMWHFALCLFCSPFVALTSGQMPNFAQESPFTDGIRISHVIHDKLKIHKDVSVVEEAIQAAAKLWGKHLKLRTKTDRNLLIPRKCNGEFELIDDQLICASECLQSLQCGQYVVPSTYLKGCEVHTADGYTEAAPDGTGLADVDFLVILELLTEEECSGILTKPDSCSADFVTDRPVAGVIAVCPRMLSTAVEITTNVFVRDLGHLLGINWERYRFFRDQNGVPRTRRIPKSNLPATVSSETQSAENPESFIMQALNPDLPADLPLKTKGIITLPTVKEVVKHVFKAPNAVGLRVEPASITKPFQIRFDPIITQDDIMATDLNDKSRISMLSLAFMYDTGWYHVSSANAERITWGYAAGDDFLSTTCDEFMRIQKKAGKPLAPFCGWEQYNLPSCLPDHSGFGLCNIRESTEGNIEPPALNVQLKLRTYSGPEHPDKRCPIIKRSPDIRLANRLNDQCKLRVKETPQENYALEYFGSSSICVDHNQQAPLVFSKDVESIELDGYGASCHYHVCEPMFGLRIHFGNKFVYCPLEGGPVVVEVNHGKIGKLSGSILCPPCPKICPEENCQVGHPSVCPLSREDEA
ncbi:Leishmanolysin-like peptidase [Clonorchis sinensis]|uniref:Leishmanolysin-like peptidase n=1 Tax=Clonorchis sinensis TaxID=79923 RepID=A0A8T1MR87_CLOSI|nr:Leishmanolysin-like peptidase [Clonorchis sinensis]